MRKQIQTFHQCACAVRVMAFRLIVRMVGSRCPAAKGADIFAMGITD